MKKPTFSIPVAALLVGAALGYCLAPSAAPQQPTEPAAASPATPTQSVVAAAAEPSDAMLQALRKRIRDLEALIQQERAAKSAPAQTRIDEPDAERERHPRSPREMMERLRREDPARFAQMTNSMARFRRERIARAQSKIDFLSSIDTSSMSADDLKTHETLQNMIERREEIEAKMHNPDLTDEQRREVFEEMHAADREIRRLNAAERTCLLMQTAEALGYSDEDAEEIVATISEIITATEGHRGGPPPHRRHGSAQGQEPPGHE